jgi:hypothetical protein
MSSWRGAVAAELLSIATRAATSRDRARRSPGGTKNRNICDTSRSQRTLSIFDDGVRYVSAMRVRVGVDLRWLATRFYLVVGLVFLLPFPLGYLPMTAWLSSYPETLIAGLADWLGAAVFGLAARPTGPNGSGDTTYDYLRSS